MACGGWLNTRWPKLKQTGNKSDDNGGGCEWVPNQKLALKSRFRWPNFEKADVAACFGLQELCHEQSHYQELHFLPNVQA